MSLDAAAIRAMANELTNTVLEAKIEKISQPERDVLVLFLRTETGHKRLLISASPQNPRVHLTDTRYENPPEAPMFCMLLRKHIGGGRITKIMQPGFERVLRFSVTARNELGDMTEKYLFAEFAGRNANIILTDADGKIIDAAHHTDLSAGRAILPGLLYTPPVPQDKTDPLLVTEAEIENILAKQPAETRADKALVRLFGGISPILARCIVQTATRDADSILEGKTAAIAASLFGYAEDARAYKFTPAVIFGEDGAPLDFTAYTPTVYEGLLPIEFKETLSEAMEVFFAVRDKTARMRRKSAAVRKRIHAVLERLYKKIDIHLSTLAESENLENYRIYGELLSANLYRLCENQDAVTVENFYADMVPVTIPMDKTKSPVQNAQGYFKKYRKLKTAQIAAKEQLYKAREEVAYMETVAEAAERVETEADLAEIRAELISGGYIKEETRGKKRKEKPAEPLSLDIDGFVVLVGRTGRQNDKVTFRLSRAEDMWLHVKNMPGAHVLIRKENREIPDAVILRAAEYAAYYSGGRNSAGVAVDYTLAKNVWKPSGAAPGMVLYKAQRTAYVTPKLQNPHA